MREWKMFLRKIVFLMMIGFLMVPVINAKDIIKITSDNIILIEPDFTDYVRDKIPSLTKKLNDLEKTKQPLRIHIKYKNFEQFWRIVKNYYASVKRLKEDIETNREKSGYLRNSILKMENYFSMTAISNILDYKKTILNIEFLETSIEILDEDFRGLIESLKINELTHLKELRELIIKPFEEKKSSDLVEEEKESMVPYYDQAVSLKSYASILVNAFSRLRKEKIDYREYEEILENNLVTFSKDSDKARHLKDLFLDVGARMSGKAQVSQEVDNLMNKAKEWFFVVYNYELYVIENRKVTLASMFASLTTIFILLIINWVSAKIILSRFVFDESKEYAINTLKKYIIYFAIFITFLNGIGLDLSKITILVSALSVGMGFGLTTVVSNFISGILLLLEGTITVGDRLQLESEEIVTVINIGLRKSLLKTLDNIDVLMPNTELVSKRVTNLTYKKNFINRHRLTFKVSNHVDIQKLEKIAVASIIKTLGGNDKVYAKTPELQFTEINSEHYACVLLFYVDYLNNFIPDSKFYKNLLYDFIDNDIRFFEDPPLNEVLAEFSRDLRSGRIKLG